MFYTLLHAKEDLLIRRLQKNTKTTLKKKTVSHTVFSALFYQKFNALPERHDDAEFDEPAYDDAAAALLPLIEEPSKDEHVEPAIAARFRVCQMVKQTFHRQLVFTGRALEVDECLVTCERKEGQRTFSHVFKLVDWYGNPIPNWLFHIRYSSNYKEFIIKFFSSLE